MAGPSVTHTGWEARLRSVIAGFSLTVGGFAAVLLVLPFVFALLDGVGLPIASDRTLRYLTVTVVTGVSFFVVVALYLTVSGHTDLITVRMPTWVEVGITLAGVAGLVLAVVGLNLLFDQFGIAIGSHQLEAAAEEDPRLPLLLVPLAILVIGPSEELLFRGAIQGRLRRAYPPLPAIAIASVFFGLGHITAITGAGRVSAVVVVLLLGSILGVLYEYTDNLVVPALAHGLYDVVAFLHLYVTTSGAV